jgi:hypothetical protein
MPRSTPQRHESSMLYPTIAFYVLCLTWFTRHPAYGWKLRGGHLDLNVCFVISNW